MYDEVETELHTLLNSTLEGDVKHSFNPVALLPERSRNGTPIPHSSSP